MDDTLRILILDDSASDVGLIAYELRKAGLTFVSKHVTTEQQFTSAIHEFEPSVILTDYSIPGFSGETALTFVREHCPNTPLIFISGTLPAEKAVDLLKCGAADYVMKDSLRPRLGIAIRRALHEAQERMVRLQAQKMEVFGSLAGGVAHDFNNLLTVIGGYSELLMADLAPDDPNRSYIEEIAKAAERATSLTSQLLAFTRRQVTKPKVLNLNEVIDDVSKMLSRLIGEDVHLVSELAPQLGSIKADASQLQQIIVNLAVNARDAMPHGGTLRIKTENSRIGITTAEPDPSRGGVGAVRPPLGDYVRLSVTDTGMGMTEEVRAKIFEPFFTTKAAGRGTGLGLATCHNIITQSNGYVEVETAPGLGTTFHLYFPRVPERSESLSASRGAAAVPRGSETILVVDDDASVRQLTVSVLEKLGYSVLEADDGESALALAKANTGRALDLIITDVVMPKMSGKDLALSIRSIYPNLRILFTSGYPTPLLDDPAVVRQTDLFVTKPLLPATLAQQVREVLDR